MNKSFEEQMEKLEQIVEELEKGNLNLDDSVAKFEDVKEQIIGNLMQQAQQNKYAQLMKELENKYEVKRA